ncbi:MAG: UDP-N-acetylmuramate dehydrogenase [Caldicoprobacterales bacterium]|jgi:UDP-N-acetylmuramate dehydrogenase|nr:UDP-N-acetylmuramate dehydrogenase [Clostridiales bacterium]
MNLEKACQALSEFLEPDQLLLNENMSKHTSFRIGGPVDLMVLPSKTEQIQNAIRILREYDIPVMVMGNGSNLLVRDKGIRGAVMKIADRFSQAEVKNETVHAQAGILLSALSRLALKSGLKGLEFASGIPGTLGGAVTMNAGAYGGEMKDVIKWACVMDEDGEVTVLDKDSLALGYRTSIIQSTKRIVLEVFLQLKAGDYEESRALIQELTKRRREKQPLQYPSAGSAFKRPVGYYAGKLIQDAGLKGMRVGDAQISEIHSGFIINLGNATACDVIELIEKVKTRVKEQAGIELHPEVRIVGED